MAFRVTPPFGLQIEVALLIEVGAVDNCATATLNVGPEVFAEQGAASTRRTQYVVLLVGLTVIDAAVCPEMMLSPTVPPVPHWYVAFAALVPPEAVNVVLPPTQIEFVPVMVVGAVEIGYTVTVAPVV